MSNRDGSLSSLLALEDGRYSATLKMDEPVGSEFVIFLADSGERCGQGGSCTSLILWFDSSLLEIQVSRAGDRGWNMYPLSMWVDGGALFDGTPADSQATEYNCWGWPTDECPFSYMYSTDPLSTLSSATPNSTVYMTFCPPDGPALSSIGPNPNPPEIIPSEHGTNIIIGTDTTVPVSTFWTPITSHKAPGGASPTPSVTSMDDAALSAYCKTMVIPACIRPQTFLPIDETTTVPIGRPLYATLLTTTVSGVVGPVTITPTVSPPDYGPPEIFPTFFDLSTTTVVPISTVTPTQTPTRPREESSPLMTAPPTVITDTLGPPDATLTVLAATVPTFSVVTDSRGSAVSTLSSDLVTTILPPSSTSPPQTFYTLTQWTTYSSVNGTTIPIVGGQVGVLTTVPVTYVLEPSTTIPVQVLSSISAQSTRTSLPSASADAENVRSGTSEGSKVAAAVVGSLVGLTLLSLLLWTVCFRRKRARRSADYAAHRTPMWVSGPGSAHGSGSEEGSGLDLDGGEAGPRDSFVEPWVVPHSQAQGSGSSTSRKMQREMEEYGGGLVSATAGAGPSRSRTGASSSIGNSYGALRPSKSANRVPPELQPEALAQWPVRTNTLSSIHSSGPSPVTPVSGPTPTRPLLAPVETQPEPEPPRRGYSDEGRQGNAIPPRYNEAWNIQISPSSE
ncbi:hypothetical protein RhiLY_04806 [Ceratobasidium sp. AG-Ba]|nr:hypothetical protein RhiLY_04806 [Ceratobasidium sp. AG-Ba]